MRKLLPAMVSWALLPAAALAQSSVTVQLVPHESVHGTSRIISFGLPLPAGLLQDASQVRVRDSSGAERPAFVRSLGPWRGSRNGIRSVLIQFEDFVPSGPWQVTVDVGVPRTLSRASEVEVRSTWRLADEGTYSAADGVWEPAVYAALPPEWLASSGLLPLGSVAGRVPFLRVPLDDPMANYFAHIANQFNDYPASSELIRYLTDSEPWLYDRALAMFQLYARTGRVDVLREAHRAAQHYQSLLYTLADCPSTGTCVGQFRLKVTSPSSARDAKYSYTASLSAAYWLSGDSVLLSRIPDAAIGAVSEALPVSVMMQPNRFTERNFAVALYGLAHEYDVTGNESARTRAADLLTALETFQSAPPAGLPANGCFHYKPEEAGGAWGFSPWMSSLLGHGLYRAWESFGEERARTMLGRLAECVADRGVAAPYATASPLYWYSRYLGTSDGALEFLPGDPWSDSEHSVDVAYLMALGAWSLEPGPARDRLLLIAHRLLRSHQATLDRTYLPIGYPGNGRALYRVSPPRKYAWWYVHSPGLAPILSDGPAELAAVGVTFSPAQGGVAMEGDAALRGPAGPGGVSLQAVSSRPDLVTVPAAVEVAEGEAYAVFPIQTMPVAAPVEVTLTLSATGVARSVSFLLTPPALARVVRAASAVGGGASTSARVELNGPAPQGGVSVAIANGSPGLVSMPASLTIPAGALSASFSISTVAVAAPQTVQYTVSLGGTSASAAFQLNPLSLLRISAPTTLSRGVKTNGSVTLNSAAPAGGLTVMLGSSDSSSLSVPASVTVAAGATTASFAITAPATGASDPVTLSATSAGVTRTASVRLQNGVLSTISLLPPSMLGGASKATNSVTLTSAAPPGGVTVTLASADPDALEVPASVVVAAGSTSKGFTVTARSTSIRRQIAVTATAGGETRGQAMTIEPDQAALLALAAPAVPGGSTLTGNAVQLSAPAPAGGAVILLSSSLPAAATVPASITVPAGESRASFAILTTAAAAEQQVTIQATFGAQTGSAVLRVLPVELTGIALTATSVAGGATLQGNLVSIASPAPPAGLPVLLESSHPAAVVPPSVTIPGGQTSASFAIGTLVPAEAVDVEIRAKLGTQSRAAALRVTAIQPVSVTLRSLLMTGGFTHTGNTVKLSRPAPAGGLAVSLVSSHPSAEVPASILVAAGTDSATFSITALPVHVLTAISITASAGGGTATQDAGAVRPPSISAMLLGLTTATPGKTYTSSRISLNAKAPEGGFAVALASSHPALVQVPSEVVVPAGSNSAYFPMTLAAGAPAGSYTLTASRDGVARSASFEVLAAASATLTGFTVSASQPVGGAALSTNRITVSAAAPSEGFQVALLSSQPSVLPVPPSIAVPAGQTSVTFPLSTAPVAVAQTVVLTASLGSSVRTVSLTVQPAKLSAVSVYPSSLLGGRSTTLSKVSLTGLAAAGGFAVQLTSSHPSVVQVPASVVVPEGQSSIGYTALTQPVSAPTPVTITANAGGVVKSAVLTVQPPALTLFLASPLTLEANSTTAGHLVRLTGAAPSAGFPVALTSSNPAILAVPASVTVPAGATQASVSFSAGTPSAQTSVTVTATSGTISRSVTVKVNPPK